MTYKICVITLTRNRVPLLRRAMRSVAAQDCEFPIGHLILVDDCNETRSFLEREALANTVSWRFVSRPEGVASGVSRCAHLRNLGVQSTMSPWIAFLDDDNEFEPDHLSTLLGCAARRGCPAVYSHRALYHADSRPYLEPRLPWPRVGLNGATMYAMAREEGMVEPGSNLLRDKIFPPEKRELGLPDVDTGEWLLQRELLLRIPFPDTFSDGDLVNTVSEDVKFLRAMLKHDVPMGCTGRPTLKYYLGGQSGTTLNR